MPSPVELLREKRQTIVNQAREISQKAEAESRELTAEENQLYVKALDEADQIKAEYTRIEQAETNKNRLNDHLADLDRSAGRATRSAQPEAQRQEAGKPYGFKLRGENIELIPGSQAYNRHVPESRRGFATWITRGEIGAGAEYASVNMGVQTDLDTAGGYLTAPEEFVAGLLQTLDDEVFIRSLATKYTTLAQSIGIRMRKTKLQTFAWGAELTEPTEDTSLGFGKKQLIPHYMTGLVKLSRDTINSGVMDVERLVRSEMTRDAGELEEKAFLFGDGQEKPLGVFTNSPDGISTTRDVSEGNTTTSITFDGMLKAKYSLKQQYRRRARWLFHRDAILKIALLKDGDGQYLWQPSKAVGEPDSALGLPVLESEWTPNTFTTGKYVGALADWSQYVIGDSLDLGMQRLTELYAGKNQVALLVRRKVDGMPQLEEAFTRIKLA